MEDSNKEIISRRPKGVVTKPWLVVSQFGESRIEEVGKHSIMRRTGIPARDLRILDPTLLYPSTILGRERAIVVNLEHIKAIITANEMLVLNPKDPGVAPFVQELEHKLCNVDTPSKTGIDGSEKTIEDSPLPSKVGVPQEASDNNSPKISFNTSSKVGSSKVPPFEFRVLEICLKFVCRCLESETSTLELEAYPTLDELSVSISTFNLQRVRAIKSRLVAVTSRVQKLRDELEHLLDDDMDMAEMYLTAKLFSPQFEDSKPKHSNIDDDHTVVLEDQSDEEEIRSNKSTSGVGNRQKPKIAELEMILEAYFVQLDGALNKLSTMRDYVDNTKDYANIILDDKQNQMLQLTVVISIARVLVNFSDVIGSVLSMNIDIPITLNGSPLQFDECLIGMVVGKQKNKNTSSVAVAHNSLVSEPGMEEQRLRKLEIDVNSLATGQERMMKEMQEMLAAMNTKLDHIMTNQVRDPGEGSHNQNISVEGRTLGSGGTNREVRSNSAPQYLPKTVKLDFPRFNGIKDLTSWVCRAEQFYDFHQTPKADRTPIISWEDFKQGLLNRYGPTQFQDFFGELTKLQQTGSVREYQAQFEKLLVRVGRLTPSHQVGCFISGLKESIKADVQASRPATLSAVIGLARLYEARCYSNRRTVHPEARKTIPNRPSIPNSRPLPIKRLSPAEHHDRRSKGLCFNCNEKFSPGHRCKKLFLIEGSWSDEEDDDVDMEVIELKENEETPGISLHAIYGARAPQTMKVRGRVGQHQITLLIDSGSTHNFLNSKVARKLGVSTNSAGRFEVVVANGEKISSSGRCKGICTIIQGVRITEDYFLLPLEGCDAVLGAQWLSTLGPIIWDFSKLQMKFCHEGKEVVFTGLAAPENKVVAEKEITKEFRKKKTGALLQIYSLSVQTTQDVFNEPHGLPPPRTHDHKIPLKQGSEAVSMRPYRYPHYQKNEIEKVVAEMLNSGVIRLSQSPYSSLVLLVKKHDGSWRLCVDYRGLNRITIKDKFPIPVIDELLDELHGAKFFTKLDLRSGYHQIRVHPEDITKTAFRTHQGHYEFLVMPFGLTNAPSTFQPLMNEIFKIHLLKYLGHVITTEGVAADPTMQEWPKPKIVKALRGFLGLIGYYRKFIEHYGRIARPLTQMLKKRCFEWNSMATLEDNGVVNRRTRTPALLEPHITGNP
ncbi:unnamed protein product [Camellia sinensis]